MSRAPQLTRMDGHGADAPRQVPYDVDIEQALLGVTWSKLC